MRSIFSEYIRPTDLEFKALWKDAFLAFDTSVLLNLYEFSESTTKQLTSLMKQFKERSWLPHQVGLEFLTGRLGVVGKQSKAYSVCMENLKKIIDNIESQKGHPFVSDSEKLNALKQAVEGLKVEFDQKRKDLDRRFSDDAHLDFLLDLFEGRTGLPYSIERLEELIKEGERRYASQIPPGYEDIKNQINKCGDFIVWRQLMDYAKSNQKPMIFITDDSKPDMWEQQEGKTLGPRREMIVEFSKETGEKFYMYKSSRFMEVAAGYLGQKIEQSAIEEAKRVGSRSIRRGIAGASYYKYRNPQVVIEETYDNNYVLEIGHVSRRVSYKKFVEIMISVVPEVALVESVYDRKFEQKINSFLFERKLEGLKKVSLKYIALFVRNTHFNIDENSSPAALEELAEIARKHLAGPSDVVTTDQVQKEN